MNTRRYAVLLLALVMLSALAVPAFATAAPPTKGTITIENVQLSDFYYNNLYDYTLYRLFDAAIAFAEDGTTVKGVSYTCTDAQKSIEGFTTYFETTVNNVTGMTEAGTGEDGKLSPAAVQWVRAHISQLGTKVEAVRKSGSNSTNPWYEVARDESTVTFGNLPFGYYYIDSAAGTIVTIDTTHPDATVSDKNVPPEMEKTIAHFTNADGILHDGDIVHKDPENGILTDEGTFQIGDTVQYNVTFMVRRGAMNYRVSDAQDMGLTLKPGTVKVMKGEETVASANYDVYTAVNPEKLVTRDRFDGDDRFYDLYRSNGREGTFELEASGVYATHRGADWIGIYDANILIIFHQEFLDTITEDTEFTLVYDCVVNDEAKVVTESTGRTFETNRARLEFGRGDTVLTDTARIDSAWISVFKYEGEGDSTSIDAAGNTPLNGVKFVLKNSEGKYLKQGDGDSEYAIHWVDSIGDATEFVTGSDMQTQTGRVGPPSMNPVEETPEKRVYFNSYMPAPMTLWAGPDGLFDTSDDTLTMGSMTVTPGENGWGTGDEVITSDQGVVRIKGLTNGTYTLIETEALPGYNKAPDTPVTISRDDGITFYHVNIANKTGSVLPTTGGKGATVFYAAGMVLLLCAGYVLLRKRRAENA